MKRSQALSIILLVSLSLASCSEKETKNKDKRKTYLELFNLKGKVQSLKTTTYFADGKEEAQDSTFIRKIELQKFNEKGELISSKSYGDKKMLTDSVAFQYDDNGTAFEVFFYDQEGRVKTSSILRKNKEGLTTENAYFCHKYSEDGTLTIDTVMMYQMDYKFNDKGQAIEAVITTENPYNSMKQVFEYDDKGNKIKELVYHSDTIDFEGINKYYADGTLQETATFDYKDGKKVPREVYKYNEQGKEVEKLRYKADTLYSKVVTDYDKYGNVLSIKHVEGKRIHKPITYDKYEYDSQGNWIKRIYYEKGKASDITIREIKYFD